MIIINLGTNDGSYTRNIPARDRAFVNGYVKFLRQVRAVNPDANILCTAGVMATAAKDLVGQAVARINDFGDKKVFFKEAPLQNGEADGIGTDWHPTESTQKKFAEYLLEFIKENKLI